MESDKYQLCIVQWSKTDLRKKRTSTKKGLKMDDAKFEIFHEIQSYEQLLEGKRKRKRISKMTLLHIILNRMKQSIQE